jgi:hypothetical protein
VTRSLWYVDGTTRRITNWANLSKLEQDASWRIIKQRNLERIGALNERIEQEASSDDPASTNAATDNDQDIAREEDATPVPFPSDPPAGPSTAEPLTDLEASIMDEIRSEDNPEEDTNRTGDSTDSTISTAEEISSPAETAESDKVVENDEPTSPTPEDGVDVEEEATETGRGVSTFETTQEEPVFVTLSVEGNIEAIPPEELSPISEEGVNDELTVLDPEQVPATVETTTEEPVQFVKLSVEGTIEIIPPNELANGTFDDVSVASPSHDHDIAASSPADAASSDEDSDAFFEDNV